MMNTERTFKGDKIMYIMIDTRIKRFVEGTFAGENEEVISIHLKDIDETFHFDSDLEAQEFLNKQAIERVYDKELRTGYFDYKDEYGDIHRYFIDEVSRGKILSYREEIVSEI